MRLVGMAAAIVAAMFVLGGVLDFLRLFGIRILDIPLLLAFLGVVVLVVVKSRKVRNAAPAQASYHAHSSSPSQPNAPPPPNTYNVDEAPIPRPKRKRTIVSSEYIQMELDHDTNAMSGLVLKGSYASCRLESQSLDVLIDLWREVARADPDGLLLLETYLERNHPKWREAAASSSREKNEEQGSSSRSMSKKEAHEILGLKVDASVDEIEAAHRTAIKINHPDQGGTDGLASLINVARDVLLATK